MLATFCGRDQRRDSAEAPLVEDVRTFWRPGFDAEHVRVNLGAPDGPRIWGGPPRRLESVQAPPLGRSCRSAPLSAFRVKRTFGGCPIVSVSSEPFPGDERAVGMEQRLVSRRVPPVRHKCVARNHAARTANCAGLTHSPIWGNCLVEAD